MCKDKHTKIPPVTINTKTGLGARLLPVVSYAPDFVSDIGERPGPGALVVNVVDCVYSLPKTQVGWVNGNPYYGLFTFTQPQDVRWWDQNMYPHHMLQYTIQRKRV